MPQLFGFNVKWSSLCAAGVVVVGGLCFCVVKRAAGTSSCASALPKKMIQTKKNKPKQYVIFDFDMCLMRIHMWGTFRNQPIELIPFDPKYVGDEKLLKWLIPTLVDSGIGVGVATFGRRQVVLRAMRMLFGEDQTYFTEHNVSTPADHGVAEGFDSLRDKNIQLQAQAEKFSIKPHDILFFDDDPNNVKQALEVLQVQAVRAAPFTRDTWRMVGEDWTEKCIGKRLVFDPTATNENNGSEQ
eukprot:NODE_1406_length_931_cov_235.156463_g1084_i0.p1 GENE.NODE_1406_length_931_cov_235.156463_g1084_i0~~NODE_1406_length_931_cov_235.156463_g1084_i0.p1  ORF type:complete len:242 (-),score=38.16 NODE_1406_length_931_cov_235.156463_g1084_i0:129-854(-)